MGNKFYGYMHAKRKAANWQKAIMGPSAKRIINSFQGSTAVVQILYLAKAEARKVNKTK